MASGRRRKRAGDGHQDLEELKAVIEKRLCIVRLPPGTQESELEEVFSEFGEITECRILSGRNVAFVGFTKWAAAHHALVATDDRTSLRGHMKGETLSASFAEQTRNVGRGGGAHLAKGLDNSRIFVGGLPEDITDEGLRDLFKSFGEIQGANLLPAKSHRRCGFVNFSIWGEALDAVEALDNTQHPEATVGSEPLTVVVAEPREGGGSGGGSEWYDAGGGGGDPPRKRRRLDGGSDSQASVAEFDRLKMEYFVALTGNASQEKCTELHWALMELRPLTPKTNASSVADVASVLTKLLGISTVQGNDHPKAPTWAPPTSISRGSARPTARKGSADDDRDAKRLFIGSLPRECSDQELRALVEQIPFRCSAKDSELQECRVLEGKGCGYLRFASWDAAEEALEALHERQVTGWEFPLRAKWAERKGDGDKPPGRGTWERSSNDGSSNQGRSFPAGGGSSAGRISIDGEVEGRRLFVGQLQRTVHKAEVERIFEAYGPLEECRIIEGKGIAYITYAKERQAQKALEEMNGATLSGISRGEGLNVQFSKPR